MIKLPFKKLEVWKRSLLLAKEIYRITKKFPKDETFGLTSQLRRACISIPSNIAEGSQRSSDKDFANFLAIALGSLAELETQLILSKELGYLLQDDLTNALGETDQIAKMIVSFRKHLV